MNPNRRRFLLQSSVSLAGLSLAACASDPAKPREGPNAIVDAAFTGQAGALVSGRATYKTIQDALNARPVLGGDWQILVRRGRYHEKLTIQASGVSLIGEDRDQTVLTFDAYAGQPRIGSTGTWGTEGSATLTVKGKDFRAENLTIENSFDWIANDALDRGDPGFQRNSQALALALSFGADRTLLRNVRLTGCQDTVYAGTGRSLFDKCIISGNVDFIFGGGQSWFEDCEIVTRPAGRITTKVGYLTAASTFTGKKYGFVFLRCRLTRESPKVPSNSTALGRPWHPNGDPQAVGSAVFMECWMDDHITTDGWDSMSSTNKQGQRVTFTPEDSRFFEYRSSGPGAVASPRRRQLTEAQRAEYTRAKVLDGWNP